MKKILMMVDFYLPKPLANGICVHQIALELQEMGYEVHISSFKMNGQLKNEILQDLHLHRIRPTLFFKLRSYGEDNTNSFLGKTSYKIAMLINKFKKLLYLPVYPITSSVFIWRYYSRIKKLHQKHKFDTVISAYNPIEAVVSALMLKRKFVNIKWGMYVLDSLSNGVKIKFFSEKWSDKKGWKWERRLYSNADKVFNMACHEGHHNNKRYKPYRQKMEIVDIPLFRRFPELYDKENKNKNKFNNNYTNLVYTGALATGLRNPKYLCDYFLKLNSEKKYKLHFYSRGDCESMIEDYRNRDNGIIRHGYVEMEVALKAISEADILISIGNKNSEMIPSKTFEYMSTGKKIIHFYTSADDSSLSYYSKYPYALLIDENDNKKLNYKKINEFINTGYKVLEFKEIENLFTENTPIYTAKKIDAMLD